MNVPPEIAFKTSTIADGNMSCRFGEPAEVQTARDRFVGHSNYVCMNCNHGEEISVVSEASTKIPPSEVLVTQTSELTLMLLTADCLPTGFYDPVTKTIALGHMSRVTIGNKLPQKTIHFLQQQFNVDPANLHLFIGPHIHKNSYSFSNTDERFPEAIEQFVTRHDTTVSIDLVAAHKHQLISAGVQKEHIQVAETDTYTSDNHFSHVATTMHNQPAGRLATCIAIRA